MTNLQHICMLNELLISFKNSGSRLFSAKTLNHYFADVAKYHLQSHTIRFYSNRYIYVVHRVNSMMVVISNHVIDIFRSFWCWKANTYFQNWTGQVDQIGNGPGYRSKIRGQTGRSNRLNQYFLYFVKFKKKLFIRTGLTGWIENQ